MKVTKRYLHLAGVLFRDEANALEQLQLIRELTFPAEMGHPK